MEESLKELRDLFDKGTEAEAAGRDPDTAGPDPKSCPPLTLAYIGDAVFELIVRDMVIRRHNVPVGRLHAASSRIVCAEAQSEMVGVIEPLLNEEELHIYRRGRNAKSHTMAKNASVTDYRRATGFEALVGYLFLKGQYARLRELCEKAISVREDL